MAKFQELNDYINQVLLKLIESQGLCKYLHYETTQGEPTDPLDSPDLTLNERKQLMYSRIFPYPKVPEEGDAVTYLTVIFDNIEKAGSHYFKDSRIVFNIICHESQWRLLGKLRPYAIMEEIDTLFNNQSVIGIGKVQFERSKFGYFNKSFSGYSLVYKVVDFS